MVPRDTDPQPPLVTQGLDASAASGYTGTGRLTQAGPVSVSVPGNGWQDGTWNRRDEILGEAIVLVSPLRGGAGAFWPPLGFPSSGSGPVRPNHSLALGSLRHLLLLPTTLLR